MRYFLDPHGCAKNQVDAEIMMSTLHENGWTAVTDPADADLCIVNTCGFIESAKKESLDAVFALRQHYPASRILMTGCLAQRYGQELAQELPEVDSFFGNGDLSHLMEAVSAAMNAQHRAILPPIDLTGRTDFIGCAGTRPLLSLPGSAYLKISEGCQNFCAFCAIPLIRGPLRSRPVAEIVAEAKSLLERGIFELCLVGQDLGLYGAETDGRCRVTELLEALCTLPGQFWIRLLYIHPDHFPAGLLELCQKDERIIPYFDVPFQHASKTILKAMNRQGTAESNLALIKTIRTALPQATIRSTFLVGFPGETDQDFQDLLDFQQKAALDWLGVFTYSREEGTAAYQLKGRVSQKVAQARKKQLETAQVPITEKQVDTYLGKKMLVLVEEKVEGEDGLYLGRIASQAPDVDGATVLNSAVPLECGTCVEAAIFRRAGFDLDAAYSGK